jgi:squalene cyclase
MNKLEKHLLDESYIPREEGTLKDIDGFLEFLEDEVKTYASWKNSLNHKDRWESNDQEDESNWRMIIEELNNTMKSVKKLRDSYERISKRLKSRYGSRRL